MKCGLLALAIFCFWIIPAGAQQSDMEQWLTTGTNEARMQRFAALGVEPETAELAGGGLKWRPIRTQSHQDLAILFLPCGSLDSAYLYLVLSTDHGWHVIDNRGFDCHYDEKVSFEIAPLRSPDVDDVLVHHECEGHDTGFLQVNFNVFAIVSSKFKLLLNSEEVLKVNGWPGMDDLDQRSTFAATSAMPAVIEETRCTRKKGTVILEGRKFQWSESRLRYLPSRLVEIDSSPEKSNLVCK